MKPLSRRLVFSAFTLAELIVVIVVLSILAVIALVSYQSYTISARDGQRLSNIKIIETGLRAHGAKTSYYPKPGARAPGEEVSTGSINDTTYAYLGVVDNGVGQIIGIGKAPMDPMSGDPYLYGISANGKYFQVATVMERTEAFSLPLVQNAYAASVSSLKAKVVGDYPEYIKFTAGSDTWIANIPSILWNNDGGAVLFSTGAYPSTPHFVVNGQSNLPYALWDEPIGQSSPDEIIQSLTNSDVTAFTGVNITSILSAATESDRQQALDTVFGTGTTPWSQALIASFGWMDVIKDKVLSSSTVPAAPKTETVPVQTSWNSIDSSCTKPDIAIGTGENAQIWAWCNSTLWTIGQNYGNGSCYNYSGGNAGGALCYGKTTQESWLSGQSDNIYGALYAYDQMSANNCFGTGISATDTHCPCKSGYHVPTQDEWDQLEMNLGCGGSDKLSGTATGWDCRTSPNNSDTASGLGWSSANANSLKNKLGLVLAGYCSGWACDLRGFHGYYWSSSAYGASNGWRLDMYSNSPALYRYNTSQTDAFSVRCIKD